MPGIQNIPLESIRLDGGTQPRAVIDHAWARDFADDMEAGAKLPPIVVFFDGVDHWLADGFHRYSAARLLKRLAISAEVRKGTQRDAQLYASSANATHGHRRTSADKRHAVMRLLNDPEWSQWSSCEIARRCAVSENLVRSLRPRPSIFEEIEDAGRRRQFTRGGKVHSMDVARIGRPRFQVENRTYAPAAVSFEVTHHEYPVPRTPLEVTCQEYAVPRMPPQIARHGLYERLVEVATRLGWLLEVVADECHVKQLPVECAVIVNERAEAVT